MILELVNNPVKIQLFFNKYYYILDVYFQLLIHSMTMTPHNIYIFILLVFSQFYSITTNCQTKNQETYIELSKILVDKLQQQCIVELVIKPELKDLISPFNYSYSQCIIEDTDLLKQKISQKFNANWELSKLLRDSLLAQIKPQIRLTELVSKWYLKLLHFGIPLMWKNSLLVKYPQLQKEANLNKKKHIEMLLWADSISFIQILPISTLNEKDVIQAKSSIKTIPFFNVMVDNDLKYLSLTAYMPNMKYVIKSKLVADTSKFLQDYASYGPTVHLVGKKLFEGILNRLQGDTIYIATVAEQARLCLFEDIHPFLHKRENKAIKAELTYELYTSRKNFALQFRPDFFLRDLKTWFLYNAIPERLDKIINNYTKEWQTWVEYNYYTIDNWITEDKINPDRYTIDIEKIQILLRIPEVETASAFLLFRILDYQQSGTVTLTQLNKQWKAFLRQEVTPNLLKILGILSRNTESVNSWRNELHMQLDTEQTIQPSVFRLLPKPVDVIRVLQSSRN